MHWHSYNNAVHLLHKAKSRLFRSIMNFENHLDFICQPAVRPGCATCMTPEIQRSKGYRIRYTKLLLRR